MSTYLQYNNHMLLHPTDSSKYLSELLEPNDEITIGTQTWKMHNVTLDDGGEGIYTSIMSFGHGDQIVRYYTWEAAVRIAAKFPGWHLPTKSEWQTLVDYVGGSSVAGTKLKSTFGWPYGGAGTDDYGFEALPTGSCEPVLDEHGQWSSWVFAGEWINTYYWSATEGQSSLSTNYAYMINIHQLANADINYTSKVLAFQIRLIKGDTPPDPPAPTFDEVTIGSQTWMSKNLSIDDGGDGIYTQTVNYGQGDVTEYYYTHAAAVRIANSVEGWHLPSISETNTLYNTVGSSNTGTKLKSTYGWTSGNGTDNYGFSAFPAGYRSNGAFRNFGTRGSFWTATESYPSYYIFEFDTGSSMTSYAVDGSIAYSVRLIKDTQ